MRDLVLGALILSAVGACAAPAAGCTKSGSGPGQGAPIRPAAILHWVAFRLHDASDAEALLADCERLLVPIPGVVAYAAGQHLDTGRANVDGDYDLALLVGFSDQAAYKDYLSHPLHLELLELWKPRLAGYTIHDVLDQPVQ